MLRNQKTKAFFCLYVVALCVIYILQAKQVINTASWGLSDSSDFITRLSYHNLHANFLHLLMNVWCFLACIFAANTSFRKVLASFIIASSIPTSCLSSVPAIGLSGVDYALLGMIMWQAITKLRFNFVITLSLVIPLCLDINIANGIHAYCYGVGVLLQGLYLYWKAK